MSRASSGWLSGFGAHDWGAQDRAYASLLDALTRDRLEAEVMEREISAPAQQTVTDLKQLEHAQLDEARGELDKFRDALADVHQRAAGNDRAEVPFDSHDPRQDAAADVLIQYLVRPGYAEVRTSEPSAEHYVYFIRVDWPKLRQLADEQGHPLPD
ncbi:MAG: hypothetical protein JO352_00500 [Chloroflexi bacterium]|nr:hypothetical protein [Chloroflexota bacterium]MBV9602796.1 hypothetical protein [Chloroflexota bacterium]